MKQPVSNREKYPDAFEYFEKYAQWIEPSSYYILYSGVELFSNHPADLFNKFIDVFYGETCPV